VSAEHVHVDIDVCPTCVGERAGFTRSGEETWRHCQKGHLWRVSIVTPETEAKEP